MAQARDQDHDQPQHAEAYRLVDKERDNATEFDTWQEAQERLNEVVNLSDDASPQDFAIEPVTEQNGVQNSQNGHEPEELESDDVQGESEMDAETPEFEDRDEPDNEPTEVVVDGEPAKDPLPDRELTEDPIAWLQRGDGELTTEIKGTTVITKKGFRVLQHKYDISTGSEVLVGPEETDQEFCRVKAWAEMPDGRRAEAHASAHVDRGDDHFLLVSMADTRAKSRALSDVTGVGAVAIEEMMGVAEDA